MLSIDLLTELWILGLARNVRVCYLFKWIGGYFSEMINSGHLGRWQKCTPSAILITAAP